MRGRGALCTVEWLFLQSKTENKSGFFGFGALNSYSGNWRISRTKGN